jgi:hypothetical protein
MDGQLCGVIGLFAKQRWHGGVWQDVSGSAEEPHVFERKPNRDTRMSLLLESLNGDRARLWIGIYFRHRKREKCKQKKQKNIPKLLIPGAPTILNCRQ